MKIIVVPRQFILKMDDITIEKIMNKYNIISINTPEYKPKNILRQNPPFNEKYYSYKNVLIQYFHDCSILEKENVVYFNKDIAKRIHQFVDKRMFQDTIIHCTQGISRSAAIGYVLNEYYNKEIKQDYNQFKQKYTNLHIPNKLVLQLLSNQFNIENNYKNQQKHKKTDVQLLLNQKVLL